jgi:hypothetical protein
MMAQTERPKIALSDVSLAILSRSARRGGTRRTLPTRGCRDRPVHHRVAWGGTGASEFPGKREHRTVVKFGV